MEISPFWILVILGISGYAIPTLLTRQHPRRNRIAAHVVGAVILITSLVYATTNYTL